jgi:hypothetical protein
MWERDLRAAHLATIGEKVAVGLISVGLAAAPASAVAGGPAPEPSQQSASGTASSSGGPSPEAAPQPTTRSWPSPSPATQSSQEIHAPASAPPPASAPSSQTSAQSEGSSAPAQSPPVAPSNAANQGPSGVSRVTAGLQTAPASAPGDGSVAAGTPTSARSQGKYRASAPQKAHAARAAHQTPADRASSLARDLDPSSVLGTGLVSSAPGRPDGMLLLLGSLALGLLVFASLTLLRLLRRVGGSWYQGPQL